MKLFGYYICHTFVNQLKKLLKTWFLILILVCGLLGVIIGITAASIENAAEENKTADMIEETVPEEDNAAGNMLSTVLSKHDAADIIELAVGAAVLILLIYMANTADTSGGRIFLPADVNLLFASPLKPQSVLFFRLITRLGVLVVFVLYIPQWITAFDMSLIQASLFLASLVLIIGTGIIVQVYLYLLCSAYNNVKKNLQRGIYSLLFIAALSFFVFYKSGETDVISAAFAFFNTPVSRFIPVWGSLKGMCTAAITGNMTVFALCLAESAAVGTLLLFLISSIKADFYEDAMAKSEETAQLLEAAQSEKSSGIVRRKKDRSDKIRRDNMRHGSGANVFFFRTVYNRFRFAHFGFLTKTTESYVLAAVLVSLASRFIFNFNSILPVVLTLAGFVFFRALGNPLTDDTSKDFFCLIPEPTWKKLFYSILGSTANCFLDILPAVLIGVIISGGDLLSALIWIPFLITMDFFATNTITFINLSVPSSSGKTVKGVVFGMFIGFGLLPDIGIIALFIALNRVITGVLTASVFNAFLGFLFLALTPLLLDPRECPAKSKQVRTADELKTAKSVFSRLALSCFVILAVSSLLQILIFNFAPQLLPQTVGTDWWRWIATFAPIYLAGVPIGLAITAPIPKADLPKHSLSLKSFPAIFVICIFMMYAGNIVGILTNTLLTSIFGPQSSGGIEIYAMNDSLILKVLFMVILAPIIEEFIFRRQLIDRMHPYGEKLAVFTSALMFGLFHGNLSQFFYAFALGLVFGYVYLRTGKLRYSIALHMLINTLGSVVAPAILNNVDMESLEAINEFTSEAMRLLTDSGATLLGAYAVLMILLTLVGLVVLCIKSRKVYFRSAELELPEGSRFKTAYINTGMLLLFLSCLALIAVPFII